MLDIILGWLELVWFIHLPPIMARQDRPATLPLQGEPAAQSSWMRSRQVVASDHVSQAYWALFRDEWLELALVQGLKVSIGPGMLRYTMQTDDDGALFFYISLWPDFPSYAIPVHVPHITLAYKCTIESSEVMRRSYFAALKLLLPRPLHVRLASRSLKALSSTSCCRKFSGRFANMAIWLKLLTTCT